MPTESLVGGARRASAARAARVWDVRVLLAIVIAGSLAARLQQISRGLWLDEAWVVNSVLSGSWHNVFYYDRWYQSTPAGFLVLARAALALLPWTNATFRLVPLAFGLVGMIAFAALCRRALPAAFAVMAAAAFAFSPTAVTYSQEFKQYSADTAAAAAILLVSFLYLECPDRRRFAWLAATCALAIPVSYTASMVAPAALFAVCAAGKRTLLRIAIFSAAVGFSGLACYFLFVKPNASPVLIAFWSEQFPPGGLTAWLQFYAGAFAILLNLLPAPEGLGAMRVPTLITILAAGALTLAFARGDTALRYRRLLAMALMPVPALVLFSTLHLYPAAHVRLDLFMLGPVTFAVAVACAALWECAFRRFMPAPLGLIPRRAAAVAAAVSLVAISGIYVVRMNHRKYDVWHDAEGPLRLIRSNVQPGDLVYFHPTIAEQAMLYTRLWNWHYRPAVVGATGWPCCVRGQSEPRSTIEPAEVVRQFESQVLSRKPRRIWLAFAPGPGAWTYLRRNESAIIGAALAQRGCTESPLPKFHNSEARLFTCPAPATPAFYNKPSQAAK